MGVAQVGGEVKLKRQHKSPACAFLVIVYHAHTVCARAHIAHTPCGPIQI